MLDLSNKVVCPRCKTRLSEENDVLRCESEDCSREFPIVNGIPILIHDQKSVFAIDDFRDWKPSEFYDDDMERSEPKTNPLRKLLRKGANTLVNFPLKLDYLKGRQALEMMCDGAGARRILVVGCGTKRYTAREGVSIVHTDVAFGPHTEYVCDCHDLPFEDQTFDGVIAVAVFEHVADPYRCADEIHRVLKPHGKLYAATPFMEPVHMGRYDFTRFTFLGHRRLMRKFDGIRDGMALGPGSSLAKSIEYFLLSFSDNLNTRRFLRTIGMLLAVPFRFADRILQRKEGALDVAGGLFFYGEKRDTPIPDRVLMTMYRGRDQVYDDVDRKRRSHF